MTYPPPQQQPPVMHGYNPHPPNNDWTPAAPAKKRGPLPWLIGALVAAVVVMAGLIAALVLKSNDGNADTGKPVAAVGTTAAETVADPTPDPVYTPYHPQPADFKLTAKVTDKKCFGSAGCNVSFRVDAEYVGKFPLDDDASWLIVYEISGVEDAPQVGSFELTGTRMTINEESASTKSARSKITIKATSVEQN